MSLVALLCGSTHFEYPLANHLLEPQSATATTTSLPILYVKPRLPGEPLILLLSTDTFSPVIATPMASHCSLRRLRKSTANKKAILDPRPANIKPLFLQ